MSIFRKPKAKRGTVEPMVRQVPVSSSLNNSLASQPDLDVMNGNPGRAPFSVSLGDYEIVFRDGEWHSENTPTGKGGRDTAKLKKENKKLQEQNNLLKYKVDVLLDMLAASRADYQALEQEHYGTKGPAKRNAFR